MIAILLLLCPPSFVAAQDADPDSSPATDQGLPGEDADSALAQAKSLRDAGQFVEAAEAFEHIAAAFPHRAAQAWVRAGDCYEQAGLVPDALAAYTRASESQTAAYWRQVALFDRGRLCLREGCLDQTRVCIETLQSVYPDSPLATKASLLEAELDGWAPAEAETAYARETEARQLYDDTVALVRDNDLDGAIEWFEYLAREYRGTAAALNALERHAYLCLKTHREEDAVRSFLGILGEVGGRAPRSRIVEEAKSRLALIYRRSGDYATAQDLFESLAGEGSDQTLASRAAMHLIGMEFEQIRRDWSQKQPIAAGRYQALLERCHAVKDDPSILAVQRARAALTIVEVYCWQDAHEEAFIAADDFLTQYGGSEFVREVATVHYLLADAYIKLSRYEDALGHIAKVMEASPPGSDLWPGEQVQERAYYRAWNLLRKLRVPDDQIAEAADLMVTAFPNSPFTRSVEMVLREQARIANSYPIPPGSRRIVNRALEQAGTVPEGPEEAAP